MKNSNKLLKKPHPWTMLRANGQNNSLISVSAHDEPYRTINLSPLNSFRTAYNLMVMLISER